jgi:hypothetical protein
VLEDVQQAEIDLVQNDGPDSFTQQFCVPTVKVSIDARGDAASVVGERN